jgi:hypothetical protein
MRHLLTLLCLSTLVVLAGCSTAPERRLDPPGIEIKELSAAGENYVLSLRVVNSNAVPLVVTRSTHTLFLGSHRVGRLDDREPIGLPPLSGIEHRVTLTAASAAGVRAWLANHPGEVRAIVESTWVVAVGSDDTLTLTSAARGTLKAP